MRAGELDRKVRLEKLTVTAGTYGEAVETWTLLGEVWASRAVLSAREFFGADQVAAESVYRFRMYYRTDLDTTCRLVYEGRNYDIQAVNELGRREGLEVIAQLLNP